MTASQRWPALPLEAWRDTCATLHMYMQVVGKLTLKGTPRENHWWNATYRLSPRGLTTPTLYASRCAFTAEFDFVAHRVEFRCSHGRDATIALQPRTVADFHANVLEVLKKLDIDLPIYRVPAEVPDPIPFDEDTTHRAYDKPYATAFWRSLASMWPVFEQFRTRFVGKSSPVHFFWGSFDLALTRFNGRPMPGPAPADPMMAEAYSHECISHGWWPGGGAVPDAAFYAYARPEAQAFPAANVRPPTARYVQEYQQFILPYEFVRAAPEPERELLAFLESTYDAAATLGAWDRAALERKLSSG